MVLVHGDHAGAGPADEGRVGEAESEIGSEVPDQSSALQREDPRADTPAMKAEDAREMESWVLCLCGHGRARRKKTSGVSFGGGAGEMGCWAKRELVLSTKEQLRPFGRCSLPYFGLR